MATNLTQTVEPWYYSGDIDALTYGGVWIDTAGTNNEILEVVNGGDIGLSDDRVLVRQGHLFTERRLSEWRNVLQTIGWRGYLGFNPPFDYRSCDRTTRRGMILEALNAHFGFECSDEFEMAFDEAAAMIEHRVPLAD